MATVGKKISATTVLVGTRKGLFILRGDGMRANWRADGSMPRFHGQIVNHGPVSPGASWMRLINWPGCAA